MNFKDIFSSKNMIAFGFMVGAVIVADKIKTGSLKLPFLGKIG